MYIKPHGHKIPLLSRKKYVNVNVNTSLLRNIPVFITGF